MKLVRVMLAAAFVVAATSCDGEKAEETARTSEALPCDVARVLASSCQRCHASPPRYGAPMPLVTWSDVHAPAKSDPGQRVLDRMKVRLHDPVAPMPQGTPLPPSDLAALDAWLAADAPKGDEACAPADAGAPPAVGPDALPCPRAEQTTFVAHGAGDAPFDVPADAGNLYQCFTWKAPWTAESQAIAFAPIIDDARVVHHWILYDTATPQAEGGSGPCSMPFDARFLQGWAPGGTNRVMPADVGLALPTSERWLILQLHYWNAASLTDARDKSGVAMCTTTTLRPHTAVVSTLGTANISLAPKSAGTVTTGMCTPDATEPLHILSSSPHMHRLGKAFRTEILRGGSESNVESLVALDSWNFDLQQGYPSEMIVNPGDKLRTSCTYDNPSDKRVTFGEKTEDEMCFNFVTVWPAPGIRNAGGGAAGRCIDK